MALRAFRTVTPEISEFEAAKARWAAVSAERRAVRERVDDCRAALVLADHRDGPGEHLSPTIAEKARRYLAARRPNRDRLLRELAELEDEQAQQATSYAAEAAVWRQALDDEAARRAAAVQPKLKALVRALARSVQRVSDDVEALRSLQNQLAEVGGVAALPDLALELFGTLSEYNSPVSAWNRRALRSGLLDP
jgi:transposase